MLQTDGFGKLIVDRIIFYINVAYNSQYLEHGQKKTSHLLSNILHPDTTPEDICDQVNLLTTTLWRHLFDKECKIIKIM